MKAGMKTLTVAALGAGAMALAGIAVAQDAAQAETYRLVDVSGGALPVLVEQDGDCRDELLSGTLTLADDGTWVLVTQEREVCGDRVEEDEEREEGRYTMDGQTVRFLDEDGEAEEHEEEDAGEIEVDDLSVGTRSADGLAVRLADGQTVLAFRR